MLTQQLTPAPAGTGKLVSWLKGILIAIVVAIFLASAAASFTHVHDWTMTHSPEGTGDWFGWANAVISELVPIAAAIYYQLGKMLGYHVGKYPFAMMGGAVIFSGIAQVSVATWTIVGVLVSIFPAIAFLALSKLVIGIMQPSSTLGDQLAAATTEAQHAAGEAARLAADLAAARTQLATNAAVTDQLAEAQAEIDRLAAEREAEAAQPKMTAAERYQAKVSELVAKATAAGQPKPTMDALANTFGISARQLRRQLNGTALSLA